MLMSYALTAVLMIAQPKEDPGKILSKSESFDALLLSDGSLIVDKAAPNLKLRCKAIAHALTPYRNSHTYRTSADGRRVLLSPIQQPDAPLSTMVVKCVPNCNDPETVITFPSSFGARFLTNSAIHLFTTPDPLTRSKQRIVLLQEKEPVVLVVPRSVAWCSIGPNNNWAGWNGKSLVLGVIDTEMRETVTIALPRITSMDGFFDGTFAWMDGHVIVTGSEHVAEPSGQTSKLVITACVDLVLRDVTIIEDMHPVQQLDDTRILAMDDRGHYVLCNFKQNTLSPMDKPTGLRDSDTVNAISPSKKFWLVRRQVSPIELSREGDWCVRMLPDAAPGEEFPSIPKQPSPVGWLSISN